MGWRIKKVKNGYEIQEEILGKWKTAWFCYEKETAEMDLKNLLGFSSRQRGTLGGPPPQAAGATGVLPGRKMKERSTLSRIDRM